MAITYVSSEIQITSEAANYGTASGGAVGYLDDSTKSWTTNALAGKAIWIKTGTGAGQSRIIASNTGTRVVTDQNWATTPDATSTYVISVTPTEIIAAVPSYASWDTSSASKILKATVPIRLMSGGFLSLLNEELYFTTTRNTLLTNSGSYFQTGRRASAAFPYRGSDGGSIRSTLSGTTYWEIAWAGKMKFYGSNVTFSRGSVSDSTNAFTRINHPTTATSTGLEFYDTSLQGAIITLQSQDVCINSKTIGHNTSLGMDGSLAVASKPLIFLGNTGAISPRPSTDGGTGVNGAFLFDHESVVPFGTPDFFLFNASVTNKLVTNLVNFRISNAWTSAFRWFQGGGQPTPSGYQFRHTPIGISVVDSLGAAVNAAAVGITDSNGDGAIVTGVDASLVPVRRTVITTDSGGGYIGPIGENEGAIILFAKYTRTSEYVSAENLYGPFSATVLKPGYITQQTGKSLAARGTEGFTLVSNPYFVAAESEARAITSVSLNGVAKTASLTAPATIQDAYDYGQVWRYDQAIANDVIYDEWLSTGDGATFTQATGWVFTPAGHLDYSGKRIAGGTIAFGTPGTLSPRLGAITIRFTAAGTYAMGDADFGGAVTLTNTSGGAVTVELPVGVSYINTGPAITIVEPQVYQSITISGGVAGTTIQIFDLNGRGELANLVPTSWPYTWTDSSPYAADIRFRVRAGKVGKLLVTQEAGTATTSSPSVGFLLAQADATVYNSKGIDGSTVTGISIVDGDLTIELSGGTLVNTTRGTKLRVDAWKLFAYASWWETTEEGIRDEVQTVEAPDGGNLKIYSMGLKNTSNPSIPVEIYGAYVVDAITGYSADLIDPTGGSISFAPDHVIVQYIDLAPGSAVVTGDISEVASQCQSALTAQGITSTWIGRLDVPVSTAGGASLAQIEASTVLAKELTVASRLASADYVAPNNAGISAIDSRLPTSPASVSDVQVSGGFTSDDRMTLSSISSNTTTLVTNYVAPDNASIYSINGRLPSNPASVSDVQVSGGFTADDRALIAAIPNNILSSTVDGTLSIVDTQKVLLAAIVGKTTGVGTSSENYLAQDNSTAVISATFDSDNNRTEVTLNVA